MSYAEAIEWLYGRQQAGIKLGLANIQRLLEELGLPAPGAKILHVAGTNGKGSTCALAESVLRAAGHRTGLFTSPHLISFCERVRINGQPIDEADAAEGIERLKALASAWEEQPTFFEITTALAFMKFAEHDIDSIVLEVGLGGRLDSTNAVRPDACAITPIALDHCHILGDTLGEIAGEKAGIFKSGVSAVSAPQEDEAKAVLEARAAEVGCGLSFVESAWLESTVALAGQHQRWNAALAVAALEAGGFDVSDAAIREGLANVQWRARFERYPGEIVIDGAHNPAGMRALVETWREEFGDIRPAIVFGAASNKDLSDLIEPLLGIADCFVLTEAESQRSAKPEDLAELLPEDVSVVSVSSVPEALAIAKGQDRPVLVTGSLFLAGEIAALLDDKAEQYEPSDQ